MKTDVDRDIKELQNLFIHYKKIHKLNTKLIIGKTWCSYFDEVNNSINIDLMLVYSNSMIEDLMGETKWGVLVRTLLHEIGHALDFKYNRKQMKKKMRCQNQNLIK